MPDDQPLPEVVIAPPQLPPPPTDKSETSPTGSWEHVKSLGSIAVKIFTAVSSVVVGAFIVVSLGMLFSHRKSIELDTISVPETLSKAGFTSDVATRHLRDAIHAVQERATTSMAKTGVDTDQDLSVISIPETGLSLQNVAVAVRSLLPGWRHEVSGEFVQSESGILLRLRLNDRMIFSATGKNADADWADALLGKVDLGTGDKALDKDSLETGAFKVVRETQPYLVASALYTEGRDDNTAADKEADRIIALYPADDENVYWALNLKGLIAQDRGDDAQAEAFYRRLPRLAIARENLGELYMTQRKLQEAITEYKVAIQLDPKDANARSDLGDAYLDQHKPEMAIAEYQKAVELDPKHAPAHNGLGNFYLDQHKPEMAIAEYQKAVELDPKYAPAHNGLGNFYLDQHKPEMAIAEYQKAVELDPKYAPAHNGLANVYYYDQHKPEMAIAEYQKAIELYPKNAIPHANLGNVYLDQHKPEMAIAEYQKAVELDPKDAPSHNGLGNVYYYDQHKPEMAIAEYQKAVELDPKDAPSHNGLGNVYLDQHKPEMAIAEYQKAIELDTKYAPPHNGLGNVYYYDQHKPEMAIAEYQKAVELDTKYAPPHNGLGNLYYYDQHKPEMAIAEYQKAIELDPTDAPAYYNLGLSLRDAATSSGTDEQKANWLKEACQAFEEGGKLAPDAPDYLARTHDIDSLMNGRGHCPPT
jgi:tetratricopeptide (TPR) repeat protein